MVEVSLSLLTAISTIIVVTMTTIFFCCWRRKGTGDINEDEDKKLTETKKEPSPAPGVKENGVKSDTSTPGFVESNDDLGDFSAVQRETEILRSYRKPPPPKNRARQSRAPRAFKSSTENLDIFTELSEEDQIDSDNKENVAIKDDTDSALLRPRSTSKERTTRDARSSMLADIEQTLAAMHMTEPSPKPDGGNNTTDNLRNTTSSVEKAAKTNGEEANTKTNSELSENDQRNSAASGRESGSNRGRTSVSPEIKTESAEKASPKGSPITKPKRAPKVSPKPSPKLGARPSVEGEKPTASLSLNVPSDNVDTVTESLNGNAEKSVVKDMVDSTISKEDSHESTKTMEESTDKLTDAENTASDKSAESSVTDSGNVNGTDTNQPANTPVTDRVKDKSPSPEKDIIKDTVKKTENGAMEDHEADTDHTTQSEPSAAEPNGETTHNVSAGSSEPSSPTTEANTTLEEKEAQLNISSESDTSGHQSEGSKGKTEAASRPRRESAEDQAGKGKISKIPVFRSSSKPRSSPPRGNSGENPASPK